MKNIFKKILSVKALFNIGGDKRYIFIYHDVSDPGSSSYSTTYSTTIKRFSEQIRFLKKQFNLVELDELFNEKKSSKRPSAAVVFDDGFKSVRSNVYNIITEYKIPITVFVNRSAILNNKLWVTELLLSNKNSNEEQINFKDFEKDFEFQKSIAFENSKSSVEEEIYLNQDDVVWLSEKGISIQNHSSNHFNMKLCSNDLIEKELSENKSFIEKLTRKPVLHFAIPFGKKEHYDDRVLKIAKNTGHQFIYSSNPNCFSIKKFNAELIPRIGLTEESPKEIVFFINRQSFKKIDL